MAESKRRKRDRRCTAAERVAQGLEEEISSGALPPGTQLHEETIAHRYGVSRTPVREALRRLATSGLAVCHAHRGVFVREHELEQLEKALLELHLACARQAAPASAFLPASLSDLLRCVREGAGNQYLVEAAEAVWSKARSYLGDVETLEPTPLSGSAQTEEAVRRRLDLAWAAARSRQPNTETGPLKGPRPRQRPRRTHRPRSS